jgi:ABC-type branched-subunit amino acid transport system substrate-binding protein
MPSDDPGVIALPRTASKFELGRRRFLQAGAGLAGTAGISSLLAACGGGSSKAPTSNTSVVGASGKFDQTIEWGIFLPTSGPFVSVSAPWISGTQAVFDKINSGGGIKVKGKQVGFKVGVYNSQYAAGPALTQFRKFVSNGGHFLSGMIAVEEGVAIQGLNVRNNVLVVQIVAGKTTQLTPNSLRLFTGLDNSVTYTPLADYAKDVLSATKISSIELNNDWGH